MESRFNFLKSLKKQMQKSIASDPVKKYAATWELLKSAVEGRGHGSPARGVSSKATADIKSHLKTMLGLLIDEAKKGEIHGAAPPCYEYMLKKGVLKQLCTFAKWQNFDLLLLHHIADIVLFVSPLLGHFKQATAPLLDLLQHSESKLQLWVKNRSADVLDHHTRCLSHGFIQLVYSIAWQLQCSHSVVECVDFFFVDKTRFEFDEKEIKPTEKTASFILLEFVVPYLKRTEEVVAASEIDYDDLLAIGSTSHEIYTTEVAVDALCCVFNLQNDNVANYLEGKGCFIAGLITQNISKLCKELLDREHCDEYSTKELLMEQLQRRVQLLSAVSHHAKQHFRETFQQQFTLHVVEQVFVARLQGNLRDKENVLQLASFLLESLPLKPFCDELVAGLLSPSVKKSLFPAIMESDKCLVPSVLNLFLIMFKVRPNKVADELLAGSLKVYTNGVQPDEMYYPSLADINELFHPCLFLGDDDPKTRKDQHNTQLKMQAMCALEKGAAMLECPMKWEPVQPLSECEKPCFLELIMQRCATIFDQPIDVTLVLLDIITTMAHLNNKALSYSLFCMRSKNVLTLAQSLSALRKMTASWVEQWGDEIFKTKITKLRRSLGIINDGGDATVSERDDQAQLFEAALLLEEWRREVRETVNVLKDCTTCAEMTATIEEEEEGKQTESEEEYGY
eukprot:TRINITY_DN6477_c3_g1_i1.p1 TRINITY_DN6477_c3_g1~~TRINITY_DN6477_c3_g1_i1.p1  ORF type:complete len:712 (+),score=211.88 TRINITY_DN6477_c3_g1_i1:97-2136(+)